MANNSDPNDRNRVDERSNTLKMADEWEPDIARARAKLRARQSGPAPRSRGVWLLAAAAACLVLAVLPWPRAMAQQLWDRLVLGRIAVVQVDSEGVSEEIASVFIMESKPTTQDPV